MSQYAQVADLFRHGFPATARGRLTDAELEAAIESASGTADSYLRGRYSLPLLAWGDELTKFVCWIATFELMSGPRGFAAGSGGDSNIESRNEQATTWLRGVQAKNTHPEVTPSGGQSPSYDQPKVLSRSVISASGRTGTTRGW